jgi:NAD(P)-dependent dehydrogenase (short-subunit alcohol dehydrogenase family)
MKILMTGGTGRALLIGGTGTIGAAVAEALESSHEVIAVSRTSRPAVDLSDPRTIAALLEGVGSVDALVCCAANAPLRPIAGSTTEEFLGSVTPKLFGQVSAAIHGAARVNDGGSITLTSGAIPEGTPGAGGGALVNAGLEAFVRAASLDLDRGVRLNAVSPGWVSESLAELGMDPSEGIPVREVARAYVEAVEGAMNGAILRPGR